MLFNKNTIYCSYKICETGFNNIIFKFSSNSINARICTSKFKKKIVFNNIVGN